MSRDASVRGFSKLRVDSGSWEYHLRVRLDTHLLFCWPWKRMVHFLFFFFMERLASDLRSVPVPYFSSLLYLMCLCRGTFECKHWYILHLWLFRLSFSRFCGNKLACPVCVGFFSSKHADRIRSQLGNCYEWIQSKQLTCWWEHTASARGKFNKSSAETLWTFQLSPSLTWFFFSVFVCWGGCVCISRNIST